jgi:hypothetical protein
MANILPTTGVVAKEFLAILKNNIVFANNVNRDFQSEFTGAIGRGYAPGQTINVKRPPRYGWRAGRVALPQDTVITTAPLTLSQGGTDLQFTSLERTLSITQFERIMEAGAAAVINEIDRQGLDMARRTVANLVGTVGTYPATQQAAVALITQAQQKLDENAGPRNARKLVVSPAMNAAIVQGMSGMFNGGSRISQQNSNGMFVSGFGADVEMDQNIPRHINGTQASTGITVNGAGQTGSTLTVSATTGTITQGSVLTIAGVNAVNPQSRQDTNSFQQFVVTANVAAGSTAIPVYPSLTPAGNFQSVTASPANGAAITIVGAANAGYETDILYHRDAFTLAMVPMYEPPAGAGAKVTQMTDDGFTVKVTQFYDGINDNNIMRVDVLFGYAALYPELAVKLIA